MSPLELLNFFINGYGNIPKEKNTLWTQFDDLLKWESIANNGFQNDLCPLLYYAGMQSHHDVEKIFLNLPNNIFAKLRANYYSCLITNMVYFDLLKKISIEFNKKKIDVILLKGAYLANSVYPDPALRSMGDIDLLVRKRNINIAENVLLKMGFQYLPTHHFDGYCREYYYSGYGRQVLVEMHSDFSSGRLHIEEQIDIEKIWSRAKQEEQGGIPFCRMSIEDTIFFLSWHAAKHRFLRLVWIIDLCLLLNNNQDINYKMLIKHAKDYGTTKSLFYAFFLVRELFGITVSKDVSGPAPYRFENRLFCKTLTKTIQCKNSSKKTFLYPYLFLLRLLLIDGVRDKMNFLKETFRLTP